MKPSQGCNHKISNIMLANLTDLFIFFLFSIGPTVNSTGQLNTFWHLNYLSACL